jgi:hypothetical protein
MQTAPLPTSRCWSILRPAALCLSGAVLVCGGGIAFAGPSAVAPDVQARYDQERAKCLGGQSNQDQATCLREAGAARDAARQGELNDNGARYKHNAKERCDALTGDEAKDCVARMKGKGTVSGSVEGGGILRETVTRKVEPVGQGASAAAPP